MAKKVTSNKIESFGKANNFLVLLFNTLAGLFLAVGHVQAFDIVITTIKEIKADETSATLSIQLLVSFLVVFIISLLLGIFNKKAVAKNSKGAYVIFGILMVLILVLLFLNIALLIEL